MPFQYPMSMVGGAFERFVAAVPDCSDGIPDPSPAMLKCLEFSFPATFTLNMETPYSPYTETQLNGTLSTHFNFTSTDPACGAPNYLSRLTAVYGLEVSSQFYKLGINFNNSNGPAETPHSISRAVSWFRLIPKGNINQKQITCYLQWSALSIQYPDSYVLAYNNPVCGPSAPKPLDASETSKFKLAIGSALFDGTIYPPAETYAAAYGLTPANAVYKFITNFKFTYTVTSDPASPTADNSCVYTYLVDNRPTVLRNFTLVAYNLGALTVMPGMNFTAECFDSLQAVDLNNYAYSNSSVVCGPVDVYDRFSKFFGDDKNIVLNVLDETTRVFNVSTGYPDSNLGRRDAGDAMFRFVDTSLVVKTTTTSTSTFTATSISTFTVTSTATINSVSTKAATTAAVPSVVASGSAVTSVVSSTLASGGASGNAVPTSSVAPVPTGYAAPSAYGAPGSNNIYKGSAVKTCGAAALIVVFVFMF